MKKVKLFESFINERADYQHKESSKYPVKATVCYLDPMTRQRKCKAIFFKTKFDALGFKDNVKGFPKGAAVEAIKEANINETNVTKKDFDKVVKLLSKSKHPFTIMFVPKWDEIEIIVGQDAPDPIIDDINQRLSKAGLYNNRNISMSGDSSSYSRREYEAIERINGGHKDYY